MSNALAQLAKDKRDLQDQLRAANQKIATLEATTLNPEGRKMFKIAFDNIDKGVDARTLLEALAFNIGMRAIDAQDCRTFRPEIHEDTVGGLFRDDPIQMVEQGWSYGTEVVRRAKVQPL